MIDSPAFSRLGFGVTGPHASIIGSNTKTRELVHACVAHGVTLFDTGPAYGAGRAETRLGEALREVPRDKVFVCTKAGMHAGRFRDFSPGAVEMSLKDSLERLKTDHVDLLLLHGPAPEELTDKLIRHLEAFKVRGMIRHLGICGRGPELEAAARISAMDAVMAPLNSELTTQEIERLENCKKAGQSIIGIEVMKGAAKSARIPLNASSAWYFARHIKQVALGRTAPPSGRSPQEALSWALDHPLSDSVISLTTSLTHLDANARLAGLEGSASSA
ncbi:aldo/keto reductase [Maricaulis sp. MIT060901]|uniref:aldo/keto reductase n=1 Tax=Maricaulis sp. MIT060901 TaxID=3096993 RepID=UPI003999A1F6